MVEIDNPYFSLEEIAISGQCFRMKKINTAADGCSGSAATGQASERKSEGSDPPADCFEILALGRRLVASQRGSHITLDCSSTEFDAFWRRYFDLKTDYGAIIAAIDPEDHYLTDAAASCPGMRILRQDPWEMIVTFLISQQNNIPRIKKCVENICRLYGRDNGGFFGFPEPEALAPLQEDELMACNLGYRSKYVVRAARAVTAGMGTGRLEADCFDTEALEGLSYDEAMAALLRLFGVGAKVANCICLFGLHHVDAFPIDTHIRQILDANYPEGFPFERYRGCAGILQQYMFYYDLHGPRVNMDRQV